MDDLQILNEEDNTEEIEDGISINRYTITSYKMDRSISDLLKWKDQGKLIIPDFQRDYVWDIKTSSKFIETILLGLPTPDIFVYKDTSNNTDQYYLVDGLQRISTIESYCKGFWQANNKDKPSNFYIKNKVSKWYKKKYKDLDQIDKEFFLDYSFGLTIFDSKEINDAKIKNYMTEVFERINTGSMKLSSQEIRNAIYDGKALKFIKKIANNRNFKTLIRFDKSYKERKKDEEFALRLFAYLEIYYQIKDIKSNDYSSTCLVEGYKESKITSSKKEMLNNYLYFANKGLINYELREKQISDALESIAKKDQYAFSGVNRDATNISDKKVQEVFSEALLIAVVLSENFNEINLNQMKINIWKTDELREKFTVATTSLENVKERVQYLLELIK